MASMMLLIFILIRLAALHRLDEYREKSHMVAKRFLRRRLHPGVSDKSIVPLADNPHRHHY